MKKLVIILNLARYYAHDFEEISVAHVLREKNAKADRLSNKALKKKCKLFQEHK